MTRVRVAPIDAIRTEVVASRGGGLRWLGRLPLPGGSAGALPTRNVFRQPRRTVMTALGIAASIAVLLGVVGMLDSFAATIDDAGAELAKTAPNRLAVTLSSFDLATSPAVSTARRSPLIRRSHTSSNSRPRCSDRGEAHRTARDDRRPRKPDLGSDHP